MLHYNHYVERQLVSALRLTSKLRYYLVTKMERTLAFFGVVGAGYAGFEAVKNSCSYIQRTLELQQLLSRTGGNSGSDSE